MSLKAIRTGMRFIYALLVLLHLAGAQDPSLLPNPNISNGLCYYTIGNRSDPRYIPCGNAATGTNFACCESLDMCLSNSACYNGEFGVTYLAGCTDHLYNDDVCPDKGFAYNQQWAGLSYCNGTSDAWVACDNSESNSNTVTSPQPCWCPSTSAAYLFGAPATLDNVVILPASTGLSMTCSPGFVGCPATVSTSSSSQSSSSSSTTSSSRTSTSTLPTSSTSRSISKASSSLLSNSVAPTSSSSSATPTQPSSSPSPGAAPVSRSAGLSIGAKAGIGSGAAAGGIFAGAALWLLLRRRKRKYQSTDAQVRPRSQALAMEKDPSDELDPRSPAWSGHKSELPAEERNSLVSPMLSQQADTRPTSAEVEGSIPTYQSMNNLQAQALGEPATVYKPYKKAEVPPVQVQAVPTASVTNQSGYKAGRQVGSGVYEMPAQIPGSTML